AVGLAGAKVVRLGAAWPPSAALLRPALLEEEGKIKSFPLLVEEGWREATGWWGLKRRGGVARAPQDHRPRHCRVLPSFTGGQNQKLSDVGSRTTRSEGTDDDRTRGTGASQFRPIAKTGAVDVEDGGAGCGRADADARGGRDGRLPRHRQRRSGAGSDRSP